MNEPRKRFIAGAVCPSCQSLDSIRVWQVAGIWQRECVRCGHRQSLDEQPAATASVQPLKLIG